MRLRAAFHRDSSSTNPSRRLVPYHPRPQPSEPGSFPMVYPVIYALDPANRTVRASTHCEIDGPCFLATLTHLRTGARDRAAVIECAYELRYYLQVAEDVVIEEVQMLCPPDLTGRSGWSLEKLLSIVFFQGIEIDQSAVVYQTSEGTYKLGALDLRRKKKSVQWFSEDQLLLLDPQISHIDLGLKGHQLYAALRARYGLDQPSSRHIHS